MLSDTYSRAHTLPRGIEVLMLMVHSLSLVPWVVRRPLSSLALARHTELLSRELGFAPWVFFDQT
jgi:hypothetical protein